MTLSITTSGTGARGSLLDFVTQSRNPQSLLEDIGADVEDLIADSFDGQVSPGGRAWAPLAASTVRDRVRQGFGGSGPILRRTGRLEASFVARVDRTGVIVGSNLAYAAVQHFGRPENNQPARPIIPNARELDAIVRRRGQQYINRTLRI